MSAAPVIIIINPPNRPKRAGGPVEITPLSVSVLAKPDETMADILRKAAAQLEAE